MTPRVYATFALESHHHLAAPSLHCHVRYSLSIAYVQKGYLSDTTPPMARGPLPLPPPLQGGVVTAGVIATDAELPEAADPDEDGDEGGELVMTVTLVTMRRREKEDEMEDQLEGGT